MPLVFPTAEPPHESSDGQAPAGKPAAARIGRPTVHAIINAMVGAETMTGVAGHILKKYNRLAK